MFIRNPTTLDISLARGYISDAMAIAQEKVHRAGVALEWMRRSGLELTQSGPGAKGLGVPEPSS